MSRVLRVVAAGVGVGLLLGCGAAIAIGVSLHNWNEDIHRPEKEALARLDEAAHRFADLLKPAVAHGTPDDEQLRAAADSAGVVVAEVGQTSEATTIYTLGVEFGVPGFMNTIAVYSCHAVAVSAAGTATATITTEPIEPACWTALLAADPGLPVPRDAPDAFGRDLADWAQHTPDDEAALTYLADQHLLDVVGLEIDDKVVAVDVVDRLAGVALGPPDIYRAAYRVTVDREASSSVTVRPIVVAAAVDPLTRAAAVTSTEDQITSLLAAMSIEDSSRPWDGERINNAVGSGTRLLRWRLVGDDLTLHVAQSNSPVTSCAVVTIDGVGAPGATSHAESEACAFPFLLGPPALAPPAEPE
jgi:hypothetical protein